MTMTVDSLPTPDTQAAPPLTPSAGTLLRGYREALGLKPEALAKKLHVPVGKLLALEQDRLDALPDAMFARALALAVCRQLQTDAAPVLARLPTPDVTRLTHHNERGLDFPLKRPSLLPDSGWVAIVRWPKWLWVLVLVLAVVIWASLPSGSDVSPATPSPSLSVEAPLSVPATQATSVVVTPLQPNATVLTPVSPAVTSEGANK